jgi:hypothetical protein
MSEPERPARRGGESASWARLRPPVAWLTVGLLVACLLVVGAWLLDRDDGVADAAPGSGTTSTGAAVRSGPSGGERASSRSGDQQVGRAQVAAPAPSQVDAQRPRAVTLPSGTTMSVDAAATGPDGELVIPADVNRAGWWDGSSQLGDPFGSIVLAAHIDSFTQGLGRFAELLEVRSGDRVMLSTRAMQQEYRVVSAELVPKAALTRSSSIYSVAGEPRLVLLTCGGAYDASSGGYQDNLVVEAVPVGPLQAR